MPAGVKPPWMPAFAGMTNNWGLPPRKRGGHRDDGGQDPALGCHPRGSGGPRCSALPNPGAVSSRVRGTDLSKELAGHITRGGLCVEPASSQGFGRPSGAERAGSSPGGELRLVPGNGSLRPRIATPNEGSEPEVRR